MLLSVIRFSANCRWLKTSMEKLKRFKARLAGDTSQIVVPYEINCECGEAVRGVRRDSWIEGECSVCYQSVFVLPVNVYPSTPSVPSEIVGRDFSSRFKAAVGELFPERTVVSEADTKPEVETKKKKSRRKKDEVDESVEVTVVTPVKEEEPDVLRQRFSVRRLLARTFTPFRMLMLAMISVVGLTIYWTTFQQRAEAARQTWVAAEEKIENHLAARDMKRLEDVLIEAVAAGQMLDKSDSEWRLRLNLLTETKAVNSLAAMDLLTSFHQAYDNRNNLSSDAAETVQTSALSGTFVFDSWLLSTADGFSLVDFPATPTGHGVDIYIPFDLPEQLVNGVAEGRIVFASRIHTVVPPDASTNRNWIVLLEPESFVLLTSLPHCETVGIFTEEDPQLATVLDHQRSLVEKSTTWEHRLDNIKLPPGFRNEDDEEND